MRENSSYPAIMIENVRNADSLDLVTSYEQKLLCRVAVGQGGVESEECNGHPVLCQHCGPGLLPAGISDIAFSPRLCSPAHNRAARRFRRHSTSLYASFCSPVKICASAVPLALLTPFCADEKPFQSK